MRLKRSIQTPIEMYMSQYPISISVSLFFMHTVLVWYEELGLKHLARLCGFENVKLELPNMSCQYS